jgi:hypothetical protein
VPLEPPEPLNTLLVDHESLVAQQHPDLAVPPPRELCRELVHPRHKGHLKRRRLRQITLRTAVLIKQPTRPPLRHRMAPAQERDGIPTTRRAHHFPRCKSFNIETSNACSATIRFNREFSCSSAFKRCASSSLSAPYFVRQR